MSPLDEAALPIALLYSELHDLSAADRNQPSLRGSFAVKVIHNRRYWYHQVWVGRKRVQKTLGLETPALLEEIGRRKKEADQWRRQNKRRQQIVRSLKAALAMTTDSVTGRVIARLSEAGVFDAGAVLIGTHAYMTYGPMLGVKLAQANLRTGDIDVGAVNVAASDAEMSFSEIVQSADNAFFIVPARPGAKIPTALKYQGGEVRVELLTPLKTGRPWQPEIIKSLKFGAQRAPYLDYLIEEIVEATYLSGAGVRVKVPNPARYAWHKLIVAANRDVGSYTKILKDVAQATELFRVLFEIRSKEVADAGGRLLRRGGPYLKKAREGAVKIQDSAVQEQVLKHLTKK